MKKILFTMHAMPIGGIESALLAMLRKIDYENYSVDLLLVSCEGERLKEVPKQVNVYCLAEKERYFVENASYSIRQLKAGKHSVWCLQRIFIALKRAWRKKIGIKYDSWNKLSSYIETFPYVYEVAIDYDGSLNRFVSDKVLAKKKIMWNHFDYSFFLEEYDNDKKYFAKFDWIVSVSVPGKEMLKKYHPELSERIIHFHNMLDEQRIRQMADREASQQTFSDSEKAILKICSVGRLEKQKDFRLAVMAANELKKKCFPFVWRIVGKGSEYEALMHLIEELGLENNVFLEGAKENPYPYMRDADIYIQTSEFEGRCIAVTESQVFFKPVIVVDVQGLNDLVEDGVTGRVVARDAVAIANAIMEMTYDEIQKYEKALKKSDSRESDAMNVFYKILED